MSLPMRHSRTSAAKLCAYCLILLLSQCSANVNEMIENFDKELEKMVWESDSLETKQTNLEKLIKVKNIELDDMDAKIHESAEKFNHVLNELIDDKQRVKKELTAKLEERQRQLAKLQSIANITELNAENPALSKWVQRRVQSVGSYMDNSVSGDRLGQAVSDAVEDARMSVEALGDTVRSRVASPTLSFFFSVLVILALVALVSWVVARLTQAINSRQHLLLGHMFNLSVLLVCIVIMLASGLDPLVVMRNTSPQHSLLLMLFFCFHWPTMIMLLIHSSVTSKTAHERHHFASQAVLFSALCLHASRHCRAIILAGIERLPFWSSNLPNYFLYLVSSLVMLFLTAATLTGKHYTVQTEVSIPLLRGEGQSDFDEEAANRDSHFDSPEKQQSQIRRSSISLMSAVNSLANMSDANLKQV